jgi:hypothetical protein
MNNIFTIKVLITVLIGLFAVSNAFAQFPDLTVLDNYPNPFGTTCSIDGKPSAKPEKKKWNKLKNRFNLGEILEPITFADILGLKPFANGVIPDVANANHLRYVSIVGFVRSVAAGGTAGESCNCGETSTKFVDTHIEIVLNFADRDNKTGKGVITVEVTERSRRLAKLGLLQTNIGNDWSTTKLKSTLKNNWVKFSGWLYYDDEHHRETWQVDPNNVIGKNNWRATAWEVHPVLGIELLGGNLNNIP